MLAALRGQGGGELFEGGDNVLIWSLQFGLSEIVWGLKFQGPKCAICDLKFREGEIT